MVLQESGEMYLETIYILAQKSPYVRSIDVAEYMGFSKPSVSRGMGLLKQGGYLTADENGYLALTELGDTLSGGERQRLGVARAFLHDAPFILLDEPFAGVDPIAVADIQGIISYLRERGMGILITDHNVVETLRIVDRAYIMNEGKILVEGDVDTVLNDPLAIKYYIGNNTKL